MSDLYKRIGQRIRQERNRRRLTIEGLAELAGISTSFLSYIETNRRKASLDTIQRISRALRIPLIQLFDGL